MFCFQIFELILMYNEGVLVDIVYDDVELKISFVVKKRKNQ